MTDADTGNDNPCLEFFEPGAHREPYHVYMWNRRVWYRGKYVTSSQRGCLCEACAKRLGAWILRSEVI
jgi:hypothetical protein